MTETTAARPGRPRAFDTEAVLSCAMDLFWRNGLAASSIGEVSKATGLSSSSIYNAFGSKHDLYLLALDRYLDMLDEVMLGPMLHGDAGIADVRAFLGRLAAAAADPDAPRGCLVTRAISEIGSSDEQVADRIRRYHDSLRTALTAAFTRAAAMDGLPRADVAVLVDAVTAGVLAHNLVIGSGTSPGSPTAHLDAAGVLIARSA